MSAYKLWKRTFDILVAGIGIAVEAPLICLVALAIRLDDPGPIFVVQQRIGHHGKPFLYVKFRTMSIQPLDIAASPLFDPRVGFRIAAVGRVLRRFRLDELPVLFNILRGDMSLVGPAAALPSQFNHYSDHDKRRLDLKPGVTGYWQVFGQEQGRFDFRKMVEMDLEYAEKCSFMLDLKIIARALAITVMGRRHG